MDLDGFREYFEKKGLIKDPNWIEDTYVPNIKRVIIHLVQAGKESFVNSFRWGEFFALDLIMDTNFRFWMLEFNNCPAFNNKLKDRIYLFD